MDTSAADNLKGNLPLSLPVDIRGIISRVEETENWVSSSSVFLSEDHLQLFLARALSGMIPEDNLCWRAHMWRIRYLTAINVLARVFDEQRIERVKAALSKED